MITQDNIKKLLSVLGFSTGDSKIYSKHTSRQVLPFL